MKTEKAAKAFAHAVLEHHKDLLHGDEKVRDAVIRKSVALIALAFDIPPVKNEPLIYHDCLAVLIEALADIQEAEDGA